MPPKTYSAVGDIFRPIITDHSVVIFISLRERMDAWVNGRLEIPDLVLPLRATIFYAGEVQTHLFRNTFQHCALKWGFGWQDNTWKFVHPLLWNYPHTKPGFLRGTFGQSPGMCVWSSTWPRHCCKDDEQVGDALNLSIPDTQCMVYLFTFIWVV